MVVHNFHFWSNFIKENQVLKVAFSSARQKASDLSATHTKTNTVHALIKPLTTQAIQKWIMKLELTNIEIHNMIFWEIFVNILLTMNEQSLKNK